MNPKEIEKRINDDFAKFYNSTYNGGALPENAIELFKKALMFMPPNAHKIHTAQLLKIISNPVSALTWLEVGLVTNVIVAVRLKDLYENLDDALTQNGALEVLRTTYNQRVAELEEELARKRHTLENLAGTKKQPLKIIQAQA